MSYQVLARKWRPKAFQELVGQSHVAQTLLNALRSDRLHHALVFTGPRGTGKTSTARILAKSLRCQQATEFVPCNQCSDCVDIAQGRSIDVIEIDGASNNGVDAIRELRETVGYLPSSGRYKLYIIDEVHMLSTSAFNALLKTLEEPPPHVVFIMATTEVHKIPQTILSRCQRFDFRRIATRAIAAHLSEICRAEGIQAEEEALWLLARQGDGSMRDSQSLLDQVSTFCGSHLTQEKTLEVLGLTDRTLLLKTVSALISQNRTQIVEVIADLLIAGDGTKIFLEDLLEELRNLLLVKVGGQSREALVDLPDSEVNQLKILSQGLAEEDIHLLFDIALKGAHDLQKTQESRVALEMLLLKMAGAPRITDIVNLTGKGFLKREQKQVSAGGVSVPQMVQESVVVNSENEMESRWMELISKVKKVNPLLAAKLEHVCILGIEGKVVKLRTSDHMRFLTDQVGDKEFQKKLLNYISTFWGAGYSIEISSTHSHEQTIMSPRAREEQREQESQLHLRHQVENHPFVQSTQRIFKTQIKTIRDMDQRKREEKKMEERT